MDLKSYLLEHRSVFLVLPRFTLAEEAIPVLNTYLERNGISTILADNDDLITSTGNTHGSLAVIFSSLALALYAKLNSPHEYTIIMVEWGFDQNLLNSVLSQYSGIKTLAIRFYKKVRAVDFKIVPVEMGTKMAQIYSLMVTTENTYAARSMIGNHYFSATNVGRMRQTLANPNKQFEEISDSEQLQDNGAMGVNFAEALINNNPNFEVLDNSPKVKSAAELISSDLGKYVLVTSYPNAYGANLFRELLENTFGITPLTITANTANPELIARQFEESEVNVLITTQVPPITLTNVKAVVILDTYDVNFVTAILKRVCSKGCGGLNVNTILEDETTKYAIEVVAIPCILLTVSYPEGYIGKTVDNTQADKCVKELTKRDKSFEQLVKNADNLYYAKGYMKILS